MIILTNLWYIVNNCSYKYVLDLIIVIINRWCIVDVCKTPSEINLGEFKKHRFYFSKAVNFVLIPSVHVLLKIKKISIISFELSEFSKSFELTQ